MARPCTYIVHINIVLCYLFVYFHMLTRFLRPIRSKRRIIIASATIVRQKSLSGKRMKNPLDMPTYRVGSEIYRRNCPLEMANTTNPAVEAEYSGEEDMPTDPPPGMMASEIIGIQHGKGETKSSTDFPANSKDVFSETTKTRITLVEETKTEITVRQEDGGVHQLVGTVKYDSKQEIYYDSLKVASALIGMLKGREGHKQKKLEQKYKCTIGFPSKRSAKKEETEIRISSTRSAQQVDECREELAKAVVAARRQAMPTHFLSVPLFDAKLREQYSALVKAICEDDELAEECKHPDLFMPPPKLHLTLGVFRLFTEEEVEAARKFLDQFFHSNRIGERIRLEFPALEHFEDRSPEKVAVLFAKTQSERMQILANSLDDALFEAGLFLEKRKTPDVVLHMTVMNTKYLWEKRRSFLNVKPLLEKFGQLKIDPVEVEEVHLCEMRGSGEEMNGYRTVHQIKFTTTTTTA